jgi:hypothetical protein
MMINHKYIIFLSKKYYIKPTFRTNLIKKLKNKGITVFCYEDYISEINDINDNIYYFDDKIYPDINQLYIHLFKNEYYNDNIYSKKKIEKEKDTLILLAGKLGIKQFKYSIETKEISFFETYSKCNMFTIFKSLIKYKKKYETIEETSGNENYMNNGAPIYLLSKNINEVEEQIKNINSNIYSYDFYKSNIKLQTFVYKRFDFNMLEMEYSIDVEDISDMSIAVKLCLSKYGINILIENHKLYHEIVKCKFIFYNNDELKLFNNSHL